MIILWIVLGILGLILFLFVILFFIVLNIYNKKFNKRFTPLNIDSYTKEEFNLKTKRIEINHKGKYIRGYLYFYGNYDKNKIIVFAHGMDSSKESYIQEIQYLAKSGYLVLGFDYFGTNESDGVLKGFSNSLYSLDIVINYIKNDDELKNMEIYVIGHSWGGYATLNITKFHNDIKKIIALAPAISFNMMLKDDKLKMNLLLRLIVLLIEKIKFGKYYINNTIKNIDKYNGKIMVIQSEDDPIVSFNSSLNYIKNNTKKESEYGVVNDRCHNPDYKIEAVKKLMKFYDDFSKCKKEELNDLFAKCDFRAMGELDSMIMNYIINFIK